MRITVSVLLILGLLGACEPPPPWDTSPPLLVDTEVSTDGREVALAFDEPLGHAQTGIDGAAPQETTVEGPRVRVAVPEGLRPGSGHTWSAEVTDQKENVTSLAGKFYAANQNPAGIRLNEVRVAGSGTHTDMVELRVEAPGSLGGWTVEVWTSPGSRQRTVLPDVEVSAGELVVVRYKSPQDPTDSASGTREFWQADGKGLPGTKGLVLLRQRPDAEPTDGLLFAKKLGEGAAIAQAAGWSASPELDPSGCTATRTWCRTEDPQPQWMLVTNGGATPGKPNKLTPWEGPPSNRAGTPKTKGRMKNRRVAKTGRGRRLLPWSTARKGPREGRPSPRGSRFCRRPGRTGRPRRGPPGHGLPAEALRREGSNTRTPPAPAAVLRRPREPDGGAGPDGRSCRPRGRSPAGTVPTGGPHRAVAIPYA